MRGNLLEPLHQLAAIHLRQAKVGQHQVHRSLGKDADGLLPVGGRNHPVSVGCQHELEYGKLLFIVVYAENDLFGSHGLGMNSLVQFVRPDWAHFTPLPALDGGLAQCVFGPATGTSRPFLASCSRIDLRAHLPLRARRTCNAATGIRCTGGCLRSRSIV
jgi:hypothetical protein